MADTAAHLVDNVFPHVPVRQWVLSLPIDIRYRLAYDGELLSAVLAVFLRVVSAWYRKQVDAQSRADARCGSVTLAQRFGSSLNLNPHFHVLFLDGVYVDNGGKPAFVPAPNLTDDDVRQIVETCAHRVIRLLTKDERICCPPSRFALWRDLRLRILRSMISPKPWRRRTTTAFGCNL